LRVGKGERRKAERGCEQCGNEFPKTFHSGYRLPAPFPSGILAPFEAPSAVPRPRKIVYECGFPSEWRYNPRGFAEALALQLQNALQALS
jgi:hypothetical protein